MDTDDIGFKVEKLNGGNYHHWKFQMKMCLIGKDLWEIVTIVTGTEEGASVQFKGKLCELIVKEKHYSIGHKHGKLFKLNTEPPHKSCFGLCTSNVSSIQMWHFRYGHLGYDNLRLLKNKSMVNGFEFNPEDVSNADCEGCAMGKLHRLPFPKKSHHKSSQLLELILTDVCGPTNEC